MDKIMKFLEKYLMPLSYKIGACKLLNAIKDACILSMPFTVVGSLSGLVFSQVTYWCGQWHFKLSGALNSLVQVFGDVNVIAMGFVGVVVCLASAYYYATLLKQGKEDSKNVPLIASIIALLAYVVTLPNTIMVGKEAVTAFKINYFNYEGMFLGMVIGLLATWLYDKLVNSKFTIKLPGSVPPSVMNGFMSIIPFFVILTAFAVVKEVVLLCGFDSLDALFKQFVIGPLNGIGTGLPAVIIVIVIMQLLWFFGIHGFSIMWGLISVLWMPIFFHDVDLYAKTHSFAQITHVAPNTLSNIYAMIGGSGSTLALVVLLMVMGKKGSVERAVGNVAIIPGLFGINEPVTFGLPIVLNPIMFIPFVFVPVINAIVAYFATASGLVNPLVVLNSGAEPVLLNVWVLGAFTLSPVILYFLLFLLDLVLYYPFVKLQIKEHEAEAKKQELDAAATDEKLKEAQVV